MGMPRSVSRVYKYIAIIDRRRRLRRDPTKFHSGSLPCSMARRMSNGLRVLRAACSESVILIYSGEACAGPNAITSSCFLNDMYHAPCLGSTPWRAPSPAWRWRPNGVSSLKICRNIQKMTSRAWYCSREPAAAIWMICQTHSGGLSLCLT